MDIVYRSRRELFVAGILCNQQIFEISVGFWPAGQEFLNFFYFSQGLLSQVGQSHDPGERSIIGECR